MAYEVLSNPEKRATYDRFGMKGIQEGSGDDAMSGFPFADLFGGGLFSGLGGPFGGMGRPRRRRGEDTVHPLK